MSIAYCLLPIAFAYCLLPLPIAYCLLPIAYCLCLLPIAYCLLPLPIAYCLCLLPIAFAYCLFAYCLLPIAYCLRQYANMNSFNYAHDTYLADTTCVHLLIDVARERHHSIVFEISKHFIRLRHIIYIL